MSGREFHWRVGGANTTVRLDGDRKSGTVVVDDQELSYVVRGLSPDGGRLEIDGRSHQFFVVRNRHEVEVWIGGRTYRLENLERSHATHAAPPPGGEIRAQMPGKIVRVEIAEGDDVAASAPLLIMESMKMETTLYSPLAGRVSKVNCSVDQIVEMGELLAVIKEQAEPR